MKLGDLIGKKEKIDEAVKQVRQLISSLEQKASELRKQPRENISEATKVLAEEPKAVTAELVD
jgi:hypothetical protein